MFTSSGSTGGGRGHGGGDAKTIISPNTSFSDIINSPQVVSMCSSQYKPI